MEWRKIPVIPERKTGEIRRVKKIPILGIPYRIDIIYAYSSRDVMDFYYDRKKQALMKHLCGFREFEIHNIDFLDAVNRVSWPRESLDELGPMYIPVDKSQLSSASDKPFFEFGHFKELPLDLKLVVLYYSTSKQREALLSELSNEEQSQLLKSYFPFFIHE